MGCTVCVVNKYVAACRLPCLPLLVTCTTFISEHDDTDIIMDNYSANKLLRIYCDVSFPTQQNNTLHYQKQSFKTCLKDLRHSRLKPDQTLRTFSSVSHISCTLYSLHTANSWWELPPLSVKESGNEFKKRGVSRAPIIR